MSSLVRTYVKTNPLFHRVKQLMTSTFGATPTVDHVAIHTRQKIVLSWDEVRDAALQPEVYHFPKFQATARWYKLPRSPLKRLFMTTYQPTSLPTISSFADYSTVFHYNPFLAWTTLFDQHINHIALAVPDITQATEACVQAGIAMNTEGGLYKISQDGLLLQTATMAVPLAYTFPNGDTHTVPYTFVELVQRKTDCNGAERDGFEQDNALRIFSSTTDTTSS